MLIREETRKSRLVYVDNYYEMSSASIRMIGNLLRSFSMTYSTYMMRTYYVKTFLCDVRT